MFRNICITSLYNEQEKQFDNSFYVLLLHDLSILTTGGYKLYVDSWGVQKSCITMFRGNEIHCSYQIYFIIHVGTNHRLIHMHFCWFVCVLYIDITRIDIDSRRQGPQNVMFSLELWILYNCTLALWP